MQRSGVLHIEGMESRLDHILLARQGSSNPVGEATKFLEVTCQVDDGDTVTVEGITDKIGRNDVIYVRNAWRIDVPANGESVAVAEAAATAAPATVAPVKPKSATVKKAIPEKAAALKTPAVKEVSAKKAVKKAVTKKAGKKK